MAKRLWIRAGTLVTPHRTHEGVTLVLHDGLVEELIPGDRPAPAPDEEVIDAREYVVGPGFIDLHVHGGGGFDTMDGTAEAIEGLSAFHSRHGTTSLLPTTVAAPVGQIHAALAAVAASMERPNSGARVLGAHVEGPFLSQEKRGAHLARFVRPPAGEQDRWLWEHLPGIRRLTLAPEVPGALELTRQLRQRGVLVSLGHSMADEDLVARAVLAGASHVTHLFNAMSTMEKVGPLRRIGLAEAGLAREDLSVEVIADGWHVPLSLVRLVVRAKGVGMVALVTDAMRAAGLPEGRYLLGSEEAMGVTVRGGMAVTDEGGLAGSIAGMDQMVRNVARGVPMPLAEAWQMASLTPARILGLAGRMGEVAVGKAADLVILDRELEVVATIVDGRPVYRRGGA
ncbi:MAG: N-acetylglucosamine-6-phosphate deacetylase [Anaerolineae bacterium]|nr:N-acetylglucosamine-6-phosphate deacetylase [Anaerolineae bacterium]